MKIKLCLIAMSILTCFTSAIPVTKADFTGTWIINKGKSEFNKLPEDYAAPALVTIDQKEDSLILSRTFGNANPAVESYNFDGREFDIMLRDPKGDTRKVSSLKWADDKSRFTISSVYTVTQQGMDPWQYKRTEVYSLSGDGKALTIDKSTVFPDRTETVKAIYDKR